MSQAADDLLRAQLRGLRSRTDDGDWRDVVSRVRRARRRRALGVAGIASLVLVGVASAVVLTRPTVDFDSAPKGSDEAVVNFGKQKVLSELAGMPFATLPEQARQITTVTIDGKAHVLSVAPTKAGGFCWTWSKLTGSCRAARELPAKLDAGGQVGVHGYTVISGSFLFEEASRLVAGYADGSETDIPFVWVTEPIGAGFYLFDVGARAGHELVTMTLYDEAGAVLATQKMPDMRGEAIPDQSHRLPGFGWISAPPKAIWAKRELLFDVELGPHRHYGLWIAPSTEGGTCWWSNTGSGCDNAGKPWPTTLSPEFAAKHPELVEGGALTGLAMHGGSRPALCCRVEGAARVELRYEDGTVETATPKRGYLLVVLAPEHYALGHRLEETVAYDAAGKIIGHWRYDPTRMGGAYPCDRDREKDYGYGVRMCP